MGIGPRLAELFERVVWATAPTYPPAEYSDARVWNEEALRDLLHDWIEARLIRRGDLSAMLASAAEIRSLRAALTTSLAQFIINRRRRTSATNLFKRAQAKLESDDRFQPVGHSVKPGQQLWTVKGDAHNSPSVSGVSDLVRAACELSDDELGVIRYGPFSLKSSPILRDAALGNFLAHLLKRSEGAVTLAQIAETMRRRFNLVELPVLDLDASLVSPDAGVVWQVENRELARSVLARLGQGRAAALREFHRNEGNFRAAAEALGIDEIQVVKLVKQSMGLIAEYADSLDEALAVYDRVLESLF